jgi:formylglycine-generating enzyme required for sulfatase activity
VARANAALYLSPMPAFALPRLLLGLTTLGLTGRATEVVRPIEAAIAIPAGPFTMGSSPEAQAAAVAECKEEIGQTFSAQCLPDLYRAEGPERQVYLSAFSIDRVEVTVRAYRACVDAGACAPEPLLQPDRRFIAPDLPITSVTHTEAARYCAFRGGRLPSEAEWERAARGRDGRVFPWGNLPERDRANHGRFASSEGLRAYPMLQPDETDGYAFLSRVGAFPHGASPDGVLDMAGNAMEWTADAYSEDPPQRGTVVNPRALTEGPLRTLRGGSFRQSLVFLRTSARDGAPEGTRSPEIGFRCAR